VRAAGLPCRVAGCNIAFAVATGDSMSDLAKAGSQRNEHEVAVHDYHHRIPVPAQYAKLTPIRGSKRPDTDRT